MIFQHSWQQVLDGTKTQTRRLVKPREYAQTYLGQRIDLLESQPNIAWVAVMTPSGHIKWHSCFDLARGQSCNLCGQSWGIGKPDKHKDHCPIIRIRTMLDQYDADCG